MGKFDHYAYGNKVRGAWEACRRQGIAFLPMVVESFGGWHEVAEREVRKLGGALARHTGQEESEAIGHLWGRLGVLHCGYSIQGPPNFKVETQYFMK